MANIQKKYSEISEILKIFWNKNKLAILCYLWKEEKNVTSIICCTDISQSQVSQYLGKMKLEWILDARKEWKEVYYRIVNPKILELIKSLKKIFN